MAFEEDTSSIACFPAPENIAAVPPSGDKGTKTKTKTKKHHLCSPGKVARCTIGILSLLEMFK